MANKRFNITEISEIRKTWNDIPIDVLSYEESIIFNKRKQAVNMYIDGCNISEISNITGVHPTRIGKLLKRCLEYDDNGEYIGYRALINYSRNNKSEKRNSNGNFSSLLKEYPTLKDFIEGCWYGDKKYTLEKNINCRTLHDKFLKECLRIGIPDYNYPFNTNNKGYVSLCKYVKDLDKKKIYKAATRESKDNMQKLLSTGYGLRYTANTYYPYSVVQIDGHIIDLMYNVEILNEDGSVDKTIATRAWVLAVIDVATRCVLGYSVSQEFNYNQHDVLQALQNAIVTPERPVITIDGLNYPDNGGYPQTAFPELKNALFDTVMLDNAKSHLSKNTLSKVVDRLNCSINYGSVATPETRGIVERFFGSLETRGFHKLPGTTGSNIKDLKRRDPEKAAIKYDITFDEIVQILDVLIAEYNNTPHTSLENLTPLECMRRRVFDNGMFPTIANEEMLKDIVKLNYLTDTRVVRGGKNGKRAYINYEGSEYRCNELSVSGQYIGQTITLSINPKDISEIDAYDEKGIFIGTLRARGEFGTKSHSIKTRKAANKLARERGFNKLDFNPAISAYEQSLNKKGKTNRRDATKADILRREIGNKNITNPDIELQKEEDHIVPINKNLLHLEITDPEEYYQAIWGKKEG